MRCDESGAQPHRQAFAVELQNTGVRINTIEPRSAVLTEGAEALVGEIVTNEQIESMESMDEAIVVLCDCREPSWQHRSWS